MSDTKVKITEVQASSAVNGDASILITQEDSEENETLYRAPLAQLLGAIFQIGTVTLGTTWSGAGPYTQTVTVTGATATANSKVDIQPDATALAQLEADGITALYIENNAGTLTAYAVGGTLSASVTVQVTLTEV